MAAQKQVLPTDALLESIHFLDLPIGVYVVAIDGEFISCNRPVRQMLGLPPEGPVHANIASFYTDPKRRAQVLEKTIAADEDGLHLQRETLAFRVNGRDLWVEDYCRPLRDPVTRELTGFIGCLVDVTAEHEVERREHVLQDRIEELTIDIGRILHANTTTLLMTQQTLDGVAEALSQATLKDVIATPTEQLDEQSIEQAAGLAAAIENLLATIKPERRAQALPESQWQVLEDSLAPLKQVRDIIPGMEMRVPALRGKAHQIIMTVGQAAPGTLPREAVREVVRAATRLESTACLIDVLLSRMAIIQMDSTLRSLRDYITSDLRTHEQKERLAVRALIDQTVQQAGEFARSARVEIQRRDREYDGHVQGVERELVRALSNLLHNAIKYSWRRDRSKNPWVTVRAYRSELMACIEFENWGVPIAQEEIDQGLIFEVGYRGKWSKDRGRLGTGIGLTDAKRTAQAHQGDLRVTSRPANPGWVRPDDPAYYTQPFITTVTLCLPEATKA